MFRREELRHDRFSLSLSDRGRDCDSLTRKSKEDSFVISHYTWTQLSFAKARDIPPPEGHNERTIHTLTGEKKSERECEVSVQIQNGEILDTGERVHVRTFRFKRRSTLATLLASRPLCPLR